MSKSALAVKLKTCTGKMFGSNLGQVIEYSGTSRRFHLSSRQMLGQYFKLASQIHHLRTVVQAPDVIQPELQTSLNKLHTMGATQG